MEKFNAEKITNEVAEITKFDVTKNELEAIVDESKKIVLDNPKDILQLKKAKENKKIIRDIEIQIEKQGKSFRDIFTKLNKDIMAKQRELTEISNPEISRLGKFIKDSEDLKIREEREKVLPWRKEELSKIKDGIEISDEEILKMDDQQFDNYTFARKEDYKIKIEEEEQKKIDIENARIEERKNQRIKRLQDLYMFNDFGDGRTFEVFEDITISMDEVENDDDDIFDKKVSNISKLVSEKQKEIVEKEAKEKLESDQKAEEERKKQEEEDAKKEAELTAKREDFKKFRKELGWTEETKDEFINREITKEDGTTVIELFKKVGEFKK